MFPSLDAAQPRGNRKEHLLSITGHAERSHCCLLLSGLGYLAGSELQTALRRSATITKGRGPGQVVFLPKEQESLETFPGVFQMLQRRPGAAATARAGLPLRLPTAHISRAGKRSPK